MPSQRGPARQSTPLGSTAQLRGYSSPQAGAGGENRCGRTIRARADRGRGGWSFGTAANLSLPAFRSDFSAACDASLAEKAASRYFRGNAEVLAGSRRHRVIGRLVNRQVRQTLVRVNRWLALPQQQDALRLMVSAHDLRPSCIRTRLHRFASRPRHRPAPAPA